MEHTPYTLSQRPKHDDLMGGKIIIFQSRQQRSRTEIHCGKIDSNFFSEKSSIFLRNYMTKNGFDEIKS